MFYKKSESFEKNLYESSNSDEDDRYILYCICEISFFYCYFSTEDTKWSLPVKSLTVFVDGHVSCCYDMLIFFFSIRDKFEFSIWTLNFMRIFIRGLEFCDFFLQLHKMQIF